MNMATKGFVFVFGIVCFICLHHDIQAMPWDDVNEDSSSLSCSCDETYYKCTLVKCYKTCDDLIKRPACPGIAEGCDKPGCLCKGDWLKNKDGKCVPSDQCPKKDD